MQIKLLSQGFALNLVLKVKVLGTRKRPIIFNPQKITTVHLVVADQFDLILTIVWFAPVHPSWRRFLALLKLFHVDAYTGCDNFNSRVTRRLVCFTSVVQRSRHTI